ncbi:ThiF family adenylyltransferase [Bradyrhizobium yuanmingense]|uniref:ThiF family adenylyltransferase n=1 Tax=Bradyrhizobium yuanmingense TaxID=108015 RepID=UPI0004B62745|nr:ThiF family adenylyltransferase [Bradyrhizobium yuanmingense]
MDEQEVLRTIDAALRQEGFKKDWSQSAHPYYVGRIERHGLEAEVSIEVPDLDFVDPPVIKLLSRGKAEGKRTPHLLGPDDMVCYVAKSAMVLDRYDPGGTILQCLKLAEKVLGDGLRGRSDLDYVDEFSQYWAAGPSILVDLPEGFRGDGEIFYVGLSRTAKDKLVLAPKDGLAPSLKALHAANRGIKATPETAPCRIVRVDRDLGADRGGALPRNLRGLAAFLDRIGVTHELKLALEVGTGLTRWIAICAPNAICLAEIQIPKQFDRPEFMKSRKSALPKLLLDRTEDVAVERHLGSPIDERFLYQRNLGTVPSLAGKNIVLIGCGTIGGFLAYNLAQSGAGSLGGCLTLIDSDRLSPANLGRHILGMSFLGQNKADGCAEYIREQLPHLAVDSRPVDATAILKSLSGDLVIDATGEEPFSIALNHHAVSQRPNYPPVLHAWIVGNGGAAQVLLCDGLEQGCFKCQKPKLAGEPRYRVMRPDSDNELLRNPACGDGLYAPFPVSASMSAAALALDLVLAWNSGDPRHRYRTRVLDPDRSFQIKDMNLTPAPECPACQTRAQ